jgi:hypothetical protein
MVATGVMKAVFATQPKLNIQHEQETGFLNLDIALLETAFVSQLVSLRTTSKLT